MKLRPLTKLERYGILGLVILLGIYFIFRYLIVNSENPPQYSIEYLDNTDSLTADTIYSPANSNSNENNAYSEASVNYKNFFPDSLTKKQWMDLNFSSKQTDVILNFKESSGGFHSAEDLQKIYVISDEKFAEMKPFMLFVSSEISISNFELNSATEEELRTIKGIGQVLAARIKKYQKSIGGFKSYEDLENVYGLEAEVIKELKKHTTLTPIKTNINDASKAELLQLPHFNFEIVSLILKERDKKRLKNLDFLSSEYLSQEQKENLNQYLEFK